MGIFDSKQPKPRQPFWLKIALLLFIGFALMQAYRGQLGLNEETPAIDDYPALRDFVSVNHWHSILDPGLGKEIEVNEQTVGAGDYAACGQQVMLKVRAIEMADQSVPEGFLIPDNPLAFTIGDGSVHPVWDRGVRGMRVGGVRQILVGTKWISPDKNSIDERPVPFLLELLSLEPYEADAEAYEHITIHRGRGKPAVCADDVLVRMRRLNEESIVVEQIDTPVAITIGQSDFGHGIDRGLIGLRPGGIRQLVIPQTYQPEQSPAFSFPEDGFAIVEIELVSYKNASTASEEPTPLEEEPTDVPDRQSP